MTLAGLCLSAMHSECQTAAFLPEPVQKCFATVDILTVFSVSKGTHPTWLRGNFHGDKEKGYAVLLVEKRTGNRVVVICRAGAKAPDLIGPGYKLPESADFLQQFKSWRVDPGPTGLDQIEFSNPNWCGAHTVWILSSGPSHNEYQLNAEELDCE